MPKAILHLLGTAQPEGTGIARIVAAMAAGLDPSKYKVHAWFLAPPGPLVDELQATGVPARSINWSRGVRDPIGAFRFWRCLRTHDFAIVHQHFGARSIRHLIRLASDARILVHLHGRISESASAFPIPVAVRGADKVIAVSRESALQLPTLNPLVVYAGVEPSSEPPPEIKSPRAMIVLGTACRLIPFKGLLELIRAFASLHVEFPGLRLEIAGTGPQRADLEREINLLGLAEKVVFLGWKQNLRPTLQTWDIFALPSFDEGLPISVLEAMAEGLPVVATNVGGLPELVEDGHTGYLVDPLDVAPLTKCLRLLLLDPMRRQAMGAAGRQRVQQHFSVDRMVSEIEKIYDSLLT